jgi:hypothetical protein
MAITCLGITSPTPLTVSVEVIARVDIVQVTADSLRAQRLTTWLKNQQVDVQLTQGNPIRLVSKAIQPNTLLMLMANAKSYKVGQPALGREPEAITRANGETNIVIVNFPGQVLAEV